MPIIKSAKKRVKQTTKRHERNVGIKRDIKDATKVFITKPTAKGLSVVQSEIDTAVKKGLIKKNTAARRKSALSAIAKKAGVKLATGEKVIKKPATKTAPKTVAKAKAAPTKKTVAKKPITKKTIAKKPHAKKSAAKK
jgi:ribosomal protein S20